MKKFLFLIFLFSYSYFYSQGYYSTGYRSGFTAGCECYNEPPGTNYISGKGGYEKGYKDGQIDGRFYKLEGGAKKETYRSPYENLYLYNPNSSPYLQQAMAQKQQLINSRRLQMTNLHNEIYTIASASTTITQAQRESWEKYKTTVTSYFNQDLSNSTFYNSVISWMYEWKAYFKTW